MVTVVASIISLLSDVATCMLSSKFVTDPVLALGHYFCQVLALRCFCPYIGTVRIHGAQLQHWVSLSWTSCLALTIRLTRIRWLLWSTWNWSLVQVHDMVRIHVRHFPPHMPHELKQGGLNFNMTYLSYMSSKMMRKSNTTETMSNNQSSWMERFVLEIRDNLISYLPNSFYCNLYALLPKSKN